MEPQLKFIGTIHSPLKRLEDCPLQENEQAPEAAVHISPEFVKGIRSIKAGDRVLLITWLDKGDRSVIECIPRRNYGAPMIGVFSTRSPDRPNPIGLHNVQVLSVTPDGVIKVSALEALDQTPVIDIKPVI